MSIRLKSCSLLALAAGSMLFAAPASAETLYAGGATLPFGVYRSWFDCFGTVLNSAQHPRDALCTAAAGFPVDSSATIAYAPVGSGGGITALINQQSPNAQPSSTPYENATIVYNEGTNGYGTGPNFWDFSGSDATLNSTQISAYNSAAGAARGPAIQIPTVGTSVTIPVNVTGLNIARSTPAGGTSGLYLSRRALCGIFTGTITNWNDPILTYDNNNTQLHANLPIRVVRRSDSSGTTFLFTRHLNQVCGTNANPIADGNNHPSNPGNLAPWNLGAGTTVAWPASFLSAAGSEGVASTVASTTGAIGYVSPDFTRQVSTPEVSPAPVVANLQNQTNWAARVSDTTPTPGEHTPIAPSITNVGAATNTFAGTTTQTAAAWSAALDTAALRNPAGASVYPIIGFTMLDLYTCYFPAAEATTIKNFISWITGNHATAPLSVATQIANNAGFTMPSSTARSRVWAWVNSATAGVRTGPISGTCTISSGT
ncbi:substrate-binding domain-containing protein [Inquilinus sp. Marseille-Q2685]|uniref:substrate-binding domain-containing protein n=1 Tax=Inquilinus sp. Marseille-Q2685 TaxID=2866581 RepID=UPI001CE416B7|nr:substrate-binding domain-containing protein [Inquilinus sp. Marseille-Q2685]